MPRISEIYAGQFVNAAELPMGKRIGAVITATSAQSVGQGEQASTKIVLDLKAHDGRPWPKSVVLNKTNAVMLAAVMGDDTTAWIGKSIEVWREPVMFSGRMVDGLRMAVAPPPSNGGALPAAAPAPRAGGVFDDVGSTAAALDDEIPF